MKKENPAPFLMQEKLFNCHIIDSKAFHRYYEVGDKQRMEAIKGIE